MIREKSQKPRASRGGSLTWYRGLASDEWIGVWGQVELKATNN